MRRPVAAGAAPRRHRAESFDELTRDRMNQEMLRLWEARGLSIAFVTHSIEKAVRLSIHRMT
jgi:ABC-type nitrate/sulfonate/bicarbonate transport system ATPase subunit